MVKEWRAKWNVEPDRRPRLILWRDEHSAVIFDSRFGKGESYRITDTSDSLLKIMSGPITADDAAHRCWIGETSARKEIEFLKSRNLLFEEAGRYMSLAIE
ncbi:MAG: hypothetical protein PF904_11480 [Kiritimatiellae bacterium]|jgi:hypothetical protein|nr:hypothetical protein [Kiritimatiellia bacterium]